MQDMIVGAYQSTLPVLGDTDTFFRQPDTTDQLRVSV